MCNQTSLQRHAPPQSNQILPPPEQNNKSTYHPAQIPHPWALGELHQRPGAVYKSTRPLCFSACRIQFQSGKTWNLHVGGVPFPNVCNVPPFLPTGCGCEVLIEKRTPLPAGPWPLGKTIGSERSGERKPTLGSNLPLAVATATTTIASSVGYLQWWISPAVDISRG